MTADYSESDVRSARAERNALLCDLPASELTAILALLRPLKLTAGQVLYTAGGVLPDVLLISEGLVSLAVPSLDGARSTTLLVGPEGALGVGSVLTGAPTVDTATVVVSGSGHRLSRAGLDVIFNLHPVLARRLCAILAQQSAAVQIELACRSAHTVEQRLARLLLDVGEKVGTERVAITQEALSASLGVQRTTVSTWATRFKRQKALVYLRGAIRISDAARLQTVACPCSRAAREPGPSNETGPSRPGPESAPAGDRSDRTRQA